MFYVLDPPVAELGLIRTQLFLVVYGGFPI